jgi:hypothetical protein
MEIHPMTLLAYHADAFILFMPPDKSMTLQFILDGFPASWTYASFKGTFHAV